MKLIVVVIVVGVVAIGAVVLIHQMMITITGGEGEPLSTIEGIFIFGFIFVVFIIILISNRNNGGRFNQYDFGAKARTESEESVIGKIKAVDELFNKDEFSSWARDLFVKLQYAWSDRDWTTIRCFETNELYEQHSTQLQRYVKNKQINKIEGVSVNSVRFLSFEQSGDKDILTVVLNTKMIDYIIDEETKRIIKGDKNIYKMNNYKLTFIRKTGIKTKPGENKLNVTNCPNCGAPTEITSAGKCSYCGSVITTGEHNWVLSNLERYLY